MVQLPLQMPSSSVRPEPGHFSAESSDWLRYVAGAALLAGGVLLLNRRYRAGLVAAASGTALVLVDQEASVRRWWSMLPGLLEEATHFLVQVEGAVEELALQREKLRSLIRG
jgi:hypothetical protein